MGGQPELRLFAPRHADIAPVLDHIDGITNRETTVRVISGAAGRVDQLRQRLAGAPPDFELDAFADQFTTTLDNTVDVVVLPMGADLVDTPWVHPERGWIIDQEIPGFEQAELLSPDEYSAITREVIGTIRERTGAHVILFGASTLGEDLHPSYNGRDDDHRIRCHRLNAVQIRLSQALGVSVIDVDRIVAEVGGRDHVSAPLTYGAPVVEALADALVYVLEDIGFFERRPLVAQVGQEWGAA